MQVRASVVCVVLLLLLVGGGEGGKFLFGSSGGDTSLISWNLAFANWTGARVTLAQFATSFVGGGYFGWQLGIMNQAAASKIIPYISLDPSPLWPEPAHPNVSTEVILGQHDDFLNEYCDMLIKYLAGPDKVYNTSDDLRIHLRFAHEFNIQPFNVDPPRFILMWRHVWKFFVIRKGIDNLHVQWHWSISGGQASYDMDRAPFVIEDYYPGDAYVDWIGYDAYNWGNVTQWSHWIPTPNETHAYSIARVGAISPNKPMCIAETGCATGGGSIPLKNAWLQGLFPYVHDTNKIQMLIMFNVDADGADWTYFGTGNPKFKGNEQFQYAGDAYINKSTWIGYNGMKAVTPYVYVPNPTNKRVVTDAEFFGHLTTPVNMCPGSPPCSSRGSCDLTGKCSCIEGFSGTDCSKTASIPTCPGGPTCSGNGGCIDGVCVCLPNYVGAACQAYATAANLNNTVYHDGLSSDWYLQYTTDTPTNLSVVSPRFGNNGTSISVDLNNWGYFYVSTHAPFLAKDFGSLNFYAYVSDVKYLMNFWVEITAGNWNESTSNKLYLANYTVGATASNSWVQISMPNSAFSLKSGSAPLTGFLFRPVQTKAVIYLDEMVIYPLHPVVIPPIPTTTAQSSSTTSSSTSPSVTPSPTSPSQPPSTSSPSPSPPPSPSPSPTPAPSSSTTGDNESSAGRFFVLASLFILALLACVF